MPLVQHGSYRDLAAAIAARLADAPQQEVIVASAGLANAITAELLRGRAGVADLRVRTIDSFAKRLINDSGDYPRVAGDAERRLAMRMAVRTVDDPMMQTRGMASMLERTYRDLRDGGLTLARFEPRRARAWPCAPGASTSASSPSSARSIRRSCSTAPPRWRRARDRRSWPASTT